MKALVLALAIVPLALATGAAQGPDFRDVPDADQVVIEKAARRLTLYAGGRPVGVIEGIQLGRAPTGAKRFQGDGRTPEGRYTIDYGNPDSAYHLSLHISYPDAADRARAAAQGLSPGGAIFIHGQPNGYAGRVAGDWTEGCIAVSNAEIEWLWQAVPDGAPVDILP